MGGEKHTRRRVKTGVSPPPPLSLPSSPLTFGLARHDVDRLLLGLADGLHPARRAALVRGDEDERHHPGRGRLPPKGHRPVPVHRPHAAVGALEVADAQGGHRGPRAVAHARDRGGLGHIAPPHVGARLLQPVGGGGGSWAHHRADGVAGGAVKGRVGRRHRFHATADVLSHSLPPLSLLSLTASPARRNRPRGPWRPRRRRCLWRAALFFDAMRCAQGDGGGLAPVSSAPDVSTRPVGRRAVSVCVGRGATVRQRERGK